MGSEDFKQAAKRYLDEGVQRIQTCLSLVNQDELWHDHNEHLVSIGNLVCHLCGNVSQYILKGLGGEPFERHREAEFHAKPSRRAGELMAELETTVERAEQVIDRLTDSDLRAGYEIQGFAHTGTSAVLHVVEHFSYHVGQITFAVKWLRNVDLGYYRGINLDIR
jgi:uncharacterized damage-inducible protein DinB